MMMWNMGMSYDYNDNQAWKTVNIIHQAVFFIGSHMVQVRQIILHQYQGCGDIFQVQYTLVPSQCMTCQVYHYSCGEEFQQFLLEFSIEAWKCVTSPGGENVVVAVNFYLNLFVCSPAFGFCRRYFRLMVLNNLSISGSESTDIGHLGSIVSCVLS